MIFGGTLSRSIFWELLRVFCLTLTGLTGLFLAGLVIQNASQLGLSLGKTVAVIPLLVPMTLPYTIPATTLFAACVVYGRIAHDNEAVAVKAAGIDLLTLLRPAVLLGILTTATTAFLSYSVIPNTQRLLQDEVLKDPEEVLYNLLKKDRSYRSPGSPYVLYVKDVQNRRLIDVVFKRRKKPGPNAPADAFIGYDFIARAREAKLRVDLEKKVLIIDPDQFVAIGDGAVVNANGNREIEIPLPPVFAASEVRKRPPAMDWDDLPVRAAELQADYDILQRRYDEAKALSVARHDPLILSSQEALFVGGLLYKQREILNIWNEYYMRPALAAGCFCFALIGCPVGLRARRADYLSVFVVCFLPAAFTYYPLLLAGSNMGRSGRVPVVVGVWMANAAALFAALVLMWRLIRR
ncbi:MAG TPA: LptF/LptG family permease [Fimbriiglobus sp.]